MLSRWSRLAAAVLAALLFAPAALGSIPSAPDLALASPALPELAPASITANTDPQGCGVFCQRLEVRLEAVLLGGGEASVVTLDAWGNYRNPEELEASKNRFGFTGHQFDRETGAYYAKARYFDPGLGRFLSQDSYLGEIDSPPSLHRYAYGWNRPTFWADPTGHAPGDAWDPRTYFGSADVRAGAWSGFKQGYFDNAADIGDSVGALARGGANAAGNFVVGTVEAGVQLVDLHYRLNHGGLEDRYAASQDALAMARGAGQHFAESGRLLAQGVRDPRELLNVAADLGIEGTSEVIGGATFETALLVSGTGQGAKVAKEAIAVGGQQTATRAQVLAAVARSRAANQASRFGDYAGSARVLEAEAGAAARAAEQAAIRARVSANLAESAGSRGAADRFARYAGLDEVVALTERLPTAVVARFESAGRAFVGRNAGAPAAAREAVADLAESMGLVKPSYSFMKHAEGDVMIQAFQAGVTGRGRMFVSEPPCMAFCATALGKGGIRRMMRVMGLEELEVLWPGNAKGTMFTPLR